MKDLTILYYTASLIPDPSAGKIRDHLLKVTQNRLPVISVSQKPLNFGQNICVGAIGKSRYNVYKQILIGVRKVKTKYVACAEDDTLYSAEHFMSRPKEKMDFLYERNYWIVQSNFYWRIADVNKRGGMWGCICATETILKNLTIRYSLYPTDPAPLHNRFLFWGEPGYYDHLYGMKNHISFTESKKPCVVFNHGESIGYKQTKHCPNREGQHNPENLTYNLEGFGGVSQLWKNYWS